MTKLVIPKNAARKWCKQVNTQEMIYGFTT